MPLIVRWPGVTEAGAVDEHMVQNLDYAQTFLEAAGVAAPEGMQGRSLVPLLQGTEPEDWRSSIYYHYYAFPSIHRVARHYGIRTERHKLIHYYQFGLWELFDLQTDPDERVNLFGQEGCDELTRGLQKGLQGLRLEFGDEGGTELQSKEWQEKFGVRR